MSNRWLVVGLGNPGKQYENTRHNAGFVALEALSRVWNIPGKGQTKFNDIVGTGHVMLSGGVSVPVVLAQPTTFMNLSGEAVARLAQFYTVEAEHILVIYDDVAIPLGKIRIRPKGSAGGQNGVKSIIQHLGKNDQFPRMRIGIGAPEGQKSMTHHVLERFLPEEQALLDKVVEHVIQAVEHILTDGVEPAMNRFNGLVVE